MAGSTDPSLVREDFLSVSAATQRVTKPPPAGEHPEGAERLDACACLVAVIEHVDRAAACAAFFAKLHKLPALHLLSVALRGLAVGLGAAALVEDDLPTGPAPAP